MTNYHGAWNSHKSDLISGDIDYNPETGELAICPRRINSECRTIVMEISSSANDAKRSDAFDISEKKKVHYTTRLYNTTDIQGVYQKTTGSNEAPHQILLDHGCFSLAKVKKSENQVRANV